MFGIEKDARDFVDCRPDRSGAALGQPAVILLVALAGALRRSEGVQPRSVLILTGVTSSAALLSMLILPESHDMVLALNGRRGGDAA